ncbi:hypothetical protein RF55_9390 [Lasius niger]|uniref:Uncharacterized protein n=1 Tax=Lasius niger TaxID=67767 RepID=A0A0J7NE62_LASNI|nr:hypothetical protein RF55_9390 [Lasius niger]
MQSRKFVNQLKAVIDVAMNLGNRSMDDDVKEGRNRMQRAVYRRHNDAQRAVRFMDFRQPVRPRQDTITTVEPSICSVVNVVQSFSSREDVMKTIDDFPCWVFFNYSIDVVFGQECPHFIQIKILSRATVTFPLSAFVKMILVFSATKLIIRAALNKALFVAAVSNE